jgi:hypothetical protein
VTGKLIGWPELPRFNLLKSKEEVTELGALDIKRWEGGV